MKRSIDLCLENWKSSPQRRVLLLRGARQVGKTYSVREFAKQFSSYVEVNFVETSEVARFFQSGNLSPESIIEKLQVYYGTSIIPGETLLFLDEIQACPEAITALRFFYEKIPSLHVVAAGSLLEFALRDIPSFGVGRIESLFMYPLSFAEFLEATGNSGLRDMLLRTTPTSPTDAVLHQRAVELYRKFVILGGLPQVIQTYLDTRDLNKCLPILDGLLLGYQDDFAKYQTRISHEKLRDTLRSSALQAGRKFIYSHINPGCKISGYDQAVALLALAGLVYKVTRSAANGIPLGAELDQKNFKLIPFDLGIYNRLLGLRIADILLDDDVSFVHRGYLAEVSCGLEIIAHSAPHQRAELYFWNSENSGGNAEIDYVVQRGSTIVPVEVKAGTKGQMQSLYVFMKKKNCNSGVRASLENFSLFSPPNTPDSKVEVVPLYEVGRYLNRAS